MSKLVIGTLDNKDLKVYYTDSSIEITQLANNRDKY